MNGLDDGFVLVRPGDRQHVGEGVAHDIGLRRRPHAAGDDDSAVGVHRFLDGLKGFLLGGIEEAAGVDDDHVGAFVTADDAVSFGPQAGQDAFGIDQGLGAAEADDPHCRDGVGWRFDVHGWNIGGGRGVRHLPLPDVLAICYDCIVKRG